MILDAVEIRRRLPHRHPFLLIDRIIELESGNRAIGRKAVTANDRCLADFYIRSRFPSMFAVECMAQTAAIALWLPGNPATDMRLARIDNAWFGAAPRVGDILEVEVVIVKRFGRLIKIRGKVTVQAAPFAQAELTLYSARAGATRTELATGPS